MGGVTIFAKFFEPFVGLQTQTAMITVQIFFLDDISRRVV